MTERELLRAIAAKKPPHVDIVDWIADEASRMEGIRTACRTAERRRVEAEARYRQECQQVEAQLIHQQRHCPHYITTFHNDPSGGGDSFRTCNLCGAELP